MISEPAPAQPVAGPPARDPDEMQCEDIHETGSRLAIRRYCAPRREWEQRKQADKDAVDQIQRSPCMTQRVDSHGAHC